jgi:hypothetical protein
MTRKLLFFIFLFIYTASFGQESDYSICDCCTYSMFQFKNDYENIFNPALIKINNIKELTIYTTSKRSKNSNDTSFKTVDKEYREMIFRFNADGYVENQIIFNRRGQYHSVYDFARDNNNRVQTKTFHYLDSTGNKMEDLPERWIYSYSNNQLIKIKKLDDKFIEHPDSKSDYNAYDYDNKGREITETRQLYYDWTKPSYYQTKIKYNDSTNASIAVTKDKNKLFSTVRTKYNANHKTLNEKFLDGRNNKLLEEKTFNYNSIGQLTQFQVKNSGIGTECPDGGNFIDTYNYSSLQLIDNIRHHYRNTICELRFAYR